MVKPVLAEDSVLRRTNPRKATFDLVPRGLFRLFQDKNSLEQDKCMILLKKTTFCSNVPMFQENIAGLASRDGGHAVKKFSHSQCPKPLAPLNRGTLEQIPFFFFSFIYYYYYYFFFFSTKSSTYTYPTPTPKTEFCSIIQIQKLGTNGTLEQTYPHSIPKRTQIYFFPLRRYHLKNKNEPERVSVVKNGISQIPSLEHHPETPLPNGKVLPENLYGLGNLLRFGRSNSYTDGLVHRSQSMTGKCH
jgi:hypothetical protein